MEKKKRKRRIIIIAAISVAALVAVIVGINVIMMLSESSKMNPLDTGDVIPGVYVIKDGFVNVYLLDAGGGKYVAIDAGTSASNVKKGLDMLGISGEDVIAVLLTHTHADHTGALNVFSNAAIYGNASNFSKISVTLSDGGKTEVAGFSVQCISTPGHSGDSVCYLIDGKYLFTGDTLSLNNDKVELFNSTFNSSDEQQRADIDKLSSIGGVSYIFTAHYGFTSRAVFD